MTAGAGFDAHSFAGDPGFKSPAGPAFDLSAASMQSRIVHAGHPTLSSPVDLNGVPRNGAPDVGAYQYGAMAPGDGGIPPLPDGGFSSDGGIAPPPDGGSLVDDGGAGSSPKGCSCELGGTGAEPPISLGVVVLCWMLHRRRAAGARRVW